MGKGGCTYLAMNLSVPAMSSGVRMSKRVATTNKQKIPLFKHREGSVRSHA